MGTQRRRYDPGVRSRAAPLPGKGSGVKVAFLLPVISQARFKKRIWALRELGVDPDVFAFSRDYFDEDPSTKLPWRDLGRIRHGRYPQRVLTLVRAAGIVRRAVRGQEVVYAFGLDLLLVAYLAVFGRAPRPRLVYEVGDIRPIATGRGLRSTLVRALERFLLRRLDVLVVTSEAFVREYFLRLLQPARLPTCVVVENKLDPQLFPSRNAAVAKAAGRLSRPVTIGYFGLLRCPRSWEILKRLAENHPDRFQIMVRGFPIDPATLPDQAANIAAVQYDGPFLWPADLSAMYSAVDLVWAVYPWDPAAWSNARWARTNRFYEACYFERPMIVQRGAADAADVARHDIGLCVDLNTLDQAVAQILNITAAQIEQWRDNLRQLPPHIYTYTDEHDRLYRMLAGDIERSDGLVAGRPAQQPLIER